LDGLVFPWERTHGVSKNYDHFILNPTESNECQVDGKINSSVVSFYKDEFMVELKEVLKSKESNNPSRDRL